MNNPTLRSDKKIVLKYELKGQLYTRRQLNQAGYRTMAMAPGDDLWVWKGVKTEEEWGKKAKIAYAVWARRGQKRRDEE